MANNQPHIDSYLFQQHFDAFKAFVEEESNVPLHSFASNPYTERQEGYKYEIYSAGREALSFQDWIKADVGNGGIARAVTSAIEIPSNNLVPWQPRFGLEARPHQPLYEAMDRKPQLQLIEQSIFTLYREQQDEVSFSNLIDIFGRTYPLLGYFFFLKDRSRYLPIAPTTFDRAFELLGAEFTMSHRCSWHNYSVYLSLIGEIKIMLSESLGIEVSLLDAHSFAWILARQMERANKLPDIQEYLSLSSTEREAVIRARIGQGLFRQNLLDYWSGCAVTGCRETALLRASHIKPWAKSAVVERLHLYNGLLLSPALDACFDCGYVSFDDDGKILISTRLSTEDARALGIHHGMRLRRIELEHKKYLAYHREHVLQ